MNLVCLSGRFVRDPELRQTKSDKAVATFTLAVDHGYGEKKQTAFVSCVAWEKTAEYISKYYLKGDPIELAGKITTRTWEKDGKTQYATEIVVDHCNPTLSKKRKDEDVSTSTFEEIAGEDGELPF